MTTPTPNRTPALQAAINDLAAAMEALDTDIRLDFAMATLAAGSADSKHPPEARAFWLAVFGLTRGATDEGLEALVSTLVSGGPELRQMLVITARRAVAGDAPRAAVWQAIQDVADTVVE